MKVLVLLFLLLVPAISVSGQDRTVEHLKQQAKRFKNSKRFTVSYDKFEDQTLVKVGPFAVSGTGRYMAGGGFIFLYGAFQFKGQSLTDTPEDFVLMLEHDGNRWQFLDTREIYLLIDGERHVMKAFQKGEVKSRRRLLGSGGITHEILLASVTPDLFNKLANAKSAELRAGSYETKLKQEHQRAFRDLVSLATP